jgi:hypothetical protein
VRAAALLLLVALPQEKPGAFEAKGRLVCLVEEMKEKYKADGAPIHEHQPAFRVEGKLPDGGLRYYTILRNAMSEALFADARFKDKELRLTGRVFPSSSVVEVSRFQWYKGGKLFDVYYWCSVCAIKGVDPGPCACCQGKVELREAEVQEEKK